MSMHNLHTYKHMFQTHVSNQFQLLWQRVAWLAESNTVWVSFSLIRKKIGATRGVTVSTSAFLACHQCCCSGSSLTWGLNLWDLVRVTF